MLEWFASDSAIHLPVIHDLSTHNPSELDIKRAHSFISGLELYPFTVFQMLVAATGSFVLGYAFIKKHLSSEEVFELAKLEELFYIRFHDLEKHGPDPTQEKSFNALKRDLKACEKVIASF